MNENLYEKLKGESDDEFLIRLGQLKNTHQIEITWIELALILNSVICPDSPRTESYWRKRFHSLMANSLIPDISNDTQQSDIKRYFTEIEKQRIRAKDERLSYSREIRSQARVDEVLDLFSQEIKRYEKKKPHITERPKLEKEKAMYVMLSDMHYGLTFDSVVGKYNSELAWDRVHRYAQKIKEFGISCSTCYVSLMGDMISGLIHPGIRVENKENLIEQVVGASELVAEFLYDLSTYFDQVYVNSVDGNHSRPDPHFENTLRKERLDALVPWYCKTKLDQIDNIQFVDNVIDTTIGSFNIFNRLYVCVHGDLEKDLRSSAQNISKLICKHIDYFLSAHTHVSEFRFEDTRYVVNGSICGSGDDYTIKKRLFGPPTQTCMICTPDGVESIHPVELGGV